MADENQGATPQGIPTASTPEVAPVAMVPLDAVQAMIDAAVAKAVAQQPVFAQSGAPRTASEPVTLDLGGDVFTFGGQHWGPGVIESTNLDMIDALKAAQARLATKRQGEVSQIAARDRALDEVRKEKE